MPDSFGRPRSMIATSNGTSRPRYRPSSPSPAASTAKPSRLRRAARVSRRGASSSTSNTRMCPPGLAASVPFFLLLGRYLHDTHLAVAGQYLDAIDLVLAHIEGLHRKHLAVGFALRLCDRL